MRMQTDNYRFPFRGFVTEVLDLAIQLECVRGKTINVLPGQRSDWVEQSRRWRAD
jgi:hypothetical protein